MSALGRTLICEWTGERTLSKREVEVSAAAGSPSAQPRYPDSSFFVHHAHAICVWAVHMYQYIVRYVCQMFVFLEGRMGNI